MTKVDLKKTLKHLYNPSAKAFSVVDVPPMDFLMIDGHGDPNSSPAYQEAIQTLYAVAFTLKFALKTQERDYVVPPLEGLWWVGDQAQFNLAPKDQWDWTMMIMQPDRVTKELVEATRAEVAAKRDAPSLSQLRFETYDEGLAVQIMYVGRYADEAPTIARMHAFAAEQGYELRGKHHEIYLSDPRRTAPDKLRTVIRQPIRPRV